MRAAASGANTAACAALDLGGTAPFSLWAELIRELLPSLPAPPPDAAVAAIAERFVAKGWTALRAVTSEDEVAQRFTFSAAMRRFDALVIFDRRKRKRVAPPRFADRKTPKGRAVRLLRA